MYLHWYFIYELNISIISMLTKNFKLLTINIIILNITCCSICLKFKKKYYFFILNALHFFLTKYLKPALFAKV